MTTNETVESALNPTMPWQPTRSDRARSLIRLLLSAFITYFIVALTPLKGKLAYFFVFIAISTCINALDKFRSGGKKAAQDSLVSAIALTAGVIVFLPVDRKSTRLNSSHVSESRMPSSA